MGLRVFLLGRPEFWVGERPLTNFNSLKGQALLSYLVMTQRRHSRTALAGLLWGEMTEAAARSNLRVVLSQLKKLVGDYLYISRREVGIAEDRAIWLDVREMETAEGVELYRGDFMDDFHLPEAIIFEEWMLTQRARLQQVAIELHERLVVRQTQSGAIQAAVATARQLVGLEPWSETGQTQLIHLLALSGQTAAALGQFDAYEAELARELGVEPSAELVELVAQIRSGAVVAQTAVFAMPQPASLLPQTAPHNLPVSRSSFVGRESEKTAVLELLAKENVRLVTLLGAGGIGKTRLSLAIGQQLADQPERFLDGIYFVSLAAIQPSNRADDTDRNAIITAINRASDFPKTGQTPEVQLLNGLRDKQMLLILDNVEHLIDQAELAAGLLAAAQKLKLLVTSRERLNLYEEWVFDVRGLTVPKDEEIGAAQAERLPSVQLFTQRAQQAQRDFSLVEVLPCVSKICRLLLGMPLGIELAAAWVRTMGCDEILREMEANLDFLASQMRNVPERQRSLRSVFNYSWQLLNEAERQAFARLSYFRGGFVARAAAQVAAAPVSLLLQLVDKSLLTRDENGRFGVHELLRQFGDEQLVDKPDVAHAHARHFGWLTMEHERALLFGERSGLELLQVEAENVRLAWRWALQAGETAVLEQFLETMTVLYSRQGWFKVWRTELEQAIAVTEKMAGTEVLQSRLQMRLAEVVDQLGQFETAVLHAQTVLELAQKVGWEEQVGRAQSLLGFIWLGLGNYEVGGQTIRNGLQLAKQLNDKHGQAQALVYLNYHDTGVGERQRGRKHVEGALALFKQLGDVPNQAACLYHLGNYGIGFGDYREAMGYYDKSKRLHEQIGNLVEMADCLRNEGLCAFCLGELAKAEALSQSSLSLFRQFGEPFGMGRSLETLGRVANKREAFESARSFLSEAVQLFEANGNSARGALVRAYYGQTLTGLGELEEARNQILQALRVTNRSSAIAMRLLCFLEVAAYLVAVGEVETAVVTLGHLIKNPMTESYHLAEAKSMLNRFAAEGHIDVEWRERMQAVGAAMSLDEVTERLFQTLSKQ